MASDSIPRHKIQVPMALALGKYELLEQKELNDHLNDILAEYKRRLAKAGAE